MLALIYNDDQRVQVAEGVHVASSEIDELNRIRAHFGQGSVQELEEERRRIRTAMEERERAAEPVELRDGMMLFSGAVGDVEVPRDFDAEKIMREARERAQRSQGQPPLEG